MKRQFLKDAIADAKTVKDSAIANAKESLLESFTPGLQSMLSTKLQEMEKEDLEENEEVTEVNLDETEINLNETEDLEETEVVEAKEDDENDDSEDGEEDEENEEDEESIDLEDMTDEDLNKYIEEVVGEMVAAGEIEAGPQADMEDGEVEDLEGEPGLEDTEVMDIPTMENSEVKEDLPIDEAKEDIEEAKEEVEESKELEEVKAELEETKTELYEAYNVVKKQKETLTEMNLLNAKLLYTNKIFKSQNLTEAVKLKVLGAFDKATTIKESKLVFETLKEGLVKSDQSRTNAKQIVGSASKMMNSIKESVIPKKNVLDVDPQIARWQKLAGITPKEN